MTVVVDTYRRTKDLWEDEVLIVRLGDFFEAFDEDARILAEVCSLPLASLNGVPMSGFPYWKLKYYGALLLEAGHKIAVAERMDDE